MVSGTQLAGSLFQQNSALMGGSSCSSFSARPSWIMLMVRGVRPASKSVRCSLAMLTPRVSAPVLTQTPAPPVIAPVTAGNSEIVRVIMPPLA